MMSFAAVAKTSMDAIVDVGVFSVDVERVLNGSWRCGESRS